MVWYVFKNPKRLKGLEDDLALLYELGKRGIAGGIARFEDNDIAIGFLVPPTKEQLDFLKELLHADSYEEFDDI